MPAPLCIHVYIVLAGVAVAAAFCQMESPAVTLPTEWSFGVTDTRTYVFCYVVQYQDMNVLLF